MTTPTRGKPRGSTSVVELRSLDESTMVVAGIRAADLTLVSEEPDLTSTDSGPHCSLRT